ncbi:CDP-glycerol glycerophosphotransferase family protein [Actinocrispum wychmicini]|uniref:CDP-glycerol:poly(Glycerophosphate) glycerophosphotransferase n=1 Tax=Actinocrispum wychmicini TaxID=1213861 RepID=A0A4R2JE94_9PSEU|nr:CDP-glycerol glycerophosphotransferase family protein [Actinocrispum wychmicini]TCO57963.1 CDP-glycerol:poly(glycerophosphate) glycerophosphotransferase [Actinocrispum wychmicini]
MDRTVLIAAHTVASLMRLEDIIPLIEADQRVQLVFTQVPDELGDGVEQRLKNLEVRVIPWREATLRSFDLVVSASLHQMERVRARRRFAAPHGAGYNKLWPLLDWSGDSSARPVYGLDRESLLHNGVPVFDAIVLPHTDHLETLARQCPESLKHAVVAGDPCYDRLVTSLLDRDLYRSKLGVRDSQILVAVASTWGPQSLMATQRDLLTRLPSELPANHKVIATLHPAVWAEHGARQVRVWLREVRDAGVDLIDVGEDWRALVTSADVLIGDHSSVAVYAAGVGVPLLLSHFPATEVDPNSVMAELARLSPRLDPTRGLREQLMDALMARPLQWDAAARRVTAAHGMSAVIIRQTLYRLLELAEPPMIARWPSVPVPQLVRDE